MARRKSTIGHDPLQAISLEAPSRPVPIGSESAAAKTTRAKSVPRKAPKKEPPVIDADPVPAPIPAPLPAHPALEAQGMAIVKSYYGWSAAAGLVPIPWLDFAAVVAVQVRMVEELARLYSKPVDGQSVKPAIVGLLGTSGGFLLAGPVTHLLRVVPVVGPLAGLLALPALATASCWATGKVFIRHFEGGGTILDFDPVAAGTHYRAELTLAKGAA